MSAERAVAEFAPPGEPDPLRSLCSLLAHELDILNTREPDLHLRLSVTWLPDRVIRLSRLKRSGGLASLNQ